jgi:hypothetical protein
MLQLACLLLSILFDYEEGAACFSETLANFYQIIQLRILKNTLYSHHHVNLRFHVLFEFAFF